MRTLGKIVICEGIDCTGKTTYAQRLFNTIPSRASLMHCGPPKTASPYDEYVRPLLHARQGWTIICDRWHLGEMVWPAIFGRIPLYIDLKDMNDVEDQLLSMSVEIEALYFYRRLDDVYHELQRRGEPSAYMEKAVDLYDKAVQDSHLAWKTTTLSEALAVI